MLWHSSRWALGYFCSWKLGLIRCFKSDMTIYVQILKPSLKRQHLWCFLHRPKKRWSWNRPKGQKGLALKGTRQVEFLSQVRYCCLILVYRNRVCICSIFVLIERDVFLSLGCWWDTSGHNIPTYRFSGSKYWRRNELLVKMVST